MSKDHIETVDGVAEFMELDTTTGDLHIEHVEDAQAAVDAVAAEHALTGGKSKSGLLWKIGVIPLTVLMEYGRIRGLPRRWWDHREYHDELKALVRANPRLSPTGGVI